MTQYGQRSDPRAAPMCPRHPDRQSVDYCKRCNRPTCAECTIRTEVRSICVDCSTRKERVALAAIATPFISYGIIGTCIAVFLAGFAFPSVWQHLGFNPAVGYMQPWRFLTTAFLHAGIVHLGFNMLALYFVGPTIERAIGHWRFATTYVLSAIGGTLAVLLWVLITPSTFQQVTVGASGAVFGLFGAVFVMQRAAGIDTRSVVTLLGINLVYGFLIPNISWQAHVGGLLAGMLATWVFLQVGRPRAGITAKKQELQSIAAAVGLSIAMIAAIALTYRLIIEAFFV